jgi:hypothetical protein
MAAPGLGNGILEWLRDIVMTAETRPGTQVYTWHETTHFMRRPVAG